MGIGFGLAVIAARPTRVHVATLLWKAVVDVPCTLLRVALFVLRVVHKLLRVAPKNDTRCTKSATRRKNSNVLQFLYKALLLLRAVQKVQRVAVYTVRRRRRSIRYCIYGSTPAGHRHSVGRARSSVLAPKRYDGDRRLTSIAGRVLGDDTVCRPARARIA